MTRQRKPDWLKVRLPGGESYCRIKNLLRDKNLHTVCQSALCPNVAECWDAGTATFMVCGDTCTRACRFCAVKTSRTPPPLDTAEPMFVAESAVKLGLKYVVLTSVDRDDLPDGGAGHIAATVKAIKKLGPRILVEALVPDFRGNMNSVETIVNSGVDVYGHNIETVKPLHRKVRDPRASYEQSLVTLKHAKECSVDTRRKLLTKSSMMLGMGEGNADLSEAFDDLIKNDVDILTLGQYLQPSVDCLPVDRFVTPEEFESLGKIAESKGFLYVASGPLVRSSYKAAEAFVMGVKG